MSTSLLFELSFVACSFSKRSMLWCQYDERLLKHPKGMILHATKAL